jgi:hypothetical protein
VSIVWRFANALVRVDGILTPPQSELLNRLRSVLVAGMARSDLLDSHDAGLLDTCLHKRVSALQRKLICPSYLEMRSRFWIVSSAFNL